jgi:hypothetical protein
MAYSTDQSSSELVESVWNLFTRSTVKQLKIFSFVRESISFNEAQGAASRGKFSL